MLRRFVRNSKNDPLVDEVELTSVNPEYATYDIQMAESLLCL